VLIGFFYLKAMVRNRPADHFAKESHPSGTPIGLSCTVLALRLRSLHPEREGQTDISTYLDRVAKREWVWIQSACDIEDSKRVGSGLATLMAR
jgi:hypothetical protein